MEEVYTTEIRNIDELLKSANSESNFMGEEPIMFDDADEYYKIEDDKDVINTLAQLEEKIPSSPINLKEE